MTILMLLVLVTLALGLFMVWRGTSRSGELAKGTKGHQAPEAILAERLARGEIDPDEYRARLDALTPRDT
jgi:putative membrane protein